VLRAAPGPLSFFGPIDIVGNSSVDDDVTGGSWYAAAGDVIRAGRHLLRNLLQRIEAGGIDLLFFFT
jgi:hypothetical protein